jgi:CheY-like chemotaxis protein
MRPTPLSVLVVEDNRQTATSTAALLERAGHTVRVARDGLAALDAVRTEQPDAVLMDTTVPGLDGYELAERLRPMLTRAPLMVALSGTASNLERSRVAGIDFHFLKPVAPDILRGVLRARAVMQQRVA